MKKPRIVAVDGPAGSGKSSICATVCRDLGWSYVNTGALYRAVAILAFDRSIDVHDAAQLASVLREVADTAVWEHEHARLFVNNTDITERLGSVEAGSGASRVAKMASVRDALLPIQRRLALSAPAGAIVDGRDIGTVVFPDADLKIYMTASLEQRATRRLRQLEQSGTVTLSKDDIMRSIADRDDQDSQRDFAPLKQADGAVIFDTSDMRVDEATASLKGLLEARGLLG